MYVKPRINSERSRSLLCKPQKRTRVNNLIVPRWFSVLKHKLLRLSAQMLYVQEIIFCDIFLKFGTTAIWQWQFAFKSKNLDIVRNKKLSSILINTKVNSRISNPSKGNCRASVFNYLEAACSSCRTLIAGSHNQENGATFKSYR